MTKCDLQSPKVLIIFTFFHAICMHFLAALFKTNYNKPLSFSISGGATEVFFHVTVMSLDTIDEGSMVSDHNIK